MDLASHLNADGFQDLGYVGVPVDGLAPLRDPVAAASIALCCALFGFTRPAAALPSMGTGRPNFAT
ncbi:MAG TPA: hypothetical protein VGD71_01105, partial [Kribbella sp.]